MQKSLTRLVGYGIYSTLLIYKTEMVIFQSKANLGVNNSAGLIALHLDLVGIFNL